MLANSWTQRRRRLLLIAVPLFAITAFLIVTNHNSKREHWIPPEVAQNSRQYTVDKDTSYEHADAEFVCKAVDFKPYGKQRKVYDLIMFSTELDWLEIRLNTLYPVVDHFVIIESPTTFTNAEKPLVLRENWERYRQFWPKIIYREIHDPIKSERTWDHEDYLRNSMLYSVFPSLTGSEIPEKGDVIVVSDMDEVLRPETMILLRYCAFPARLNLRSQFYYYSFQWLHRGSQWSHPQATVYGGSIENTIAPNDLRMGLIGSAFFAYPYKYFRRFWDRGDLWNAGWHCSSCFSTIAEFQMKMNSFSHQSWNTPENRDPRIIAERVKNGQDLFGRPGEEYLKVEQNLDIPAYVIQQYQQKGRFGYLVNRDNEHASFEDWDAQMSGGG